MKAPLAVSCEHEPVSGRESFDRALDDIATLVSAPSPLDDEYLSCC